MITKEIGCNPHIQFTLTHVVIRMIPHYLIKTNKHTWITVNLIKDTYTPLHLKLNLDVTEHIRVANEP